MSYAEGTSVSPEKSEMEIRTLLRKYGAEDFLSGWSGEQVTIGFRAKGRVVRFRVILPKRDEARFRKGRNDWTPATDKQAHDRFEQEVRRLWRALVLTIKAKLECVESGIETFEHAFMANIVMPDGRTVAEHATPWIAESYRSGKVPLLLTAGGTE
jgi:hypothetical protein